MDPVSRKNDRSGGAPAFPFVAICRSGNSSRIDVYEKQQGYFSLQQCLLA
jgi:hypothetical protein